MRFIDTGCTFTSDTTALDRGLRKVRATLDKLRFDKVERALREARLRTTIPLDEWLHPRRASFLRSVSRVERVEFVAIYIVPGDDQ